MAVYLSDEVRLKAEVEALRVTCGHLMAEVERLAAERDRACVLLSKQGWKGRLGMPDEWHAERGRALAGFVGGSR